MLWKVIMQIYAIAEIFSEKSQKRQKELLINVVENMIENKEWKQIAELLVQELGYGDVVNLLEE